MFVSQVKIIIIIIENCNLNDSFFFVFVFFFSVFQNLLGTLVYGIVLYPNFACLTTEYKLIGSVLGFLYSALRYISSII